MKSLKVFTPLLVLLTTSAALGQEPQGVPNNINVQGRLNASGGGPVTAGNYTFGFKIFNASTLGTQIWPAAGSENHLIAIGTDGLWNATLGKDGGLNVATMDDTTRWLEVSVTPPVGSPETFARVKLTSNPFSLEAGQLNGKTGDEYVEIAGDVMTGRLQIDYGSNGTDIDLRQDGGTLSVFELSSGGSMKCQMVAGTKGHLVLLDDSGDPTAILDASPSGGGSVELKKADGTAGAFLGGGDNTNPALLNLNQGASLRAQVVGADKGHVALYDNSGDLTAILDATASTGGFLDLNQEDGTDGTLLRGGTTADGGTLEMRNAGGAVAVKLDASEGVVGGRLDLNHGDGTPGAFLYGGGNAGSGSGSQLSMRSEAGTVTFSVLGNSGSLGLNTGTLPDTKLHVDGGTDATLADGSGYAVIGDVNGLNIVMDNNEIQARNNAAAFPLFLQSDGGNVGIGTGSTPDTRLHVDGGTDASLADGTGDMIIGSVSSTNIVMDNNEIQGRNNGAAGALFLQSSGGDIGIGATTINAKLDVHETGAVVAEFNRNTSDGTVIGILQDNVQEGSISVSGTTVSYNAFTGSHYAWSDQPIERGILVMMTGANRSLHNSPGSEAIYGIAPSTQANDPRCLGAYLGLSETAFPESPENPHLVMAVGNGDMWVTDESGNIQPGDYLISSSTPGHAMKDTPEKYPLGYVIARAAEPVNWAGESERLGGQKHKRISVLFESFVRTGTSHLTKVIEQQRRDIEELKALVKTLMADRPLGKKQFGELK